VCEVVYLVCYVGLGSFGGVGVGAEVKEEGRRTRNRREILYEKGILLIEQERESHNSVKLR